MKCYTASGATYLDFFLDIFWSSRWSYQSIADHAGLVLITLGAYDTSLILTAT